MINIIRIRINQFLEIAKQQGLFFAIKKTIFFNSEVIPVEKELSTVKPMFSTLAKLKLEMVEITSENFDNIKPIYPLKSRYLKALNNFNKHFKSFAIMNENKIIGDIWYSTKTDTIFPFIHPDLKFLNINLGENEVYLFDMYVSPEERGKALAAPFMGGALYKLKEKGYLKAYGYFHVDNIPALWVHRLLKYKELDKLLLTNFFFLKKSKPKTEIINGKKSN